MDIYNLKRDAAHLTPLLNIGKNGVTDSLIEELLRQLKQNKLVKVKILKSALGDMDRKAISEELAKRTQYYIANNGYNRNIWSTVIGLYNVI